MAGQVAYHLLAQAGAPRAPWGITTVVSCLPVLVLAMGTALAHMLRGDASAKDTPRNWPAGPASERSPGWSAEDQPADQPDQDRGTRTTHRTRIPARTRTPDRISPPERTSEPTSPPGPAAPPGLAEDLVPGLPRQKDAQAARIARELAATGKPVSRRALRNGGVKGSNENLNALARQLNAELANEHAIVP
jgi:hypothetical protein